MLAAAYGARISKNHPFNGKNKRTVLIVIRLFLKLDGCNLLARQHEKYMTIIRVAANELSESELSDWIGSKIIELTQTLLKFCDFQIANFQIDGHTENRQNQNG
jgi:prophage maintenance system killer protein